MSSQLPLSLQAKSFRGPQPPSLLLYSFRELFSAKFDFCRLSAAWCSADSHLQIQSRHVATASCEKTEVQHGTTRARGAPNPTVGRPRHLSLGQFEFSVLSFFFFQSLKNAVSDTRSSTLLDVCTKCVIPLVRMFLLSLLLNDVCCLLLLHLSLCFPSARRRFSHSLVR